MKKVSTTFLKVVLCIMGLAVAALVIFAFPAIAREAHAELPEFGALVNLAFTGLYLSAIPFFLTLYQSVKLLQNIDTHSAFSQSSVEILKIIKYSTFSMSICYLLFMPLVYSVADYDDAPGLIILGGAICCFPFVISVFASVLEKLFQSAVTIKNENDLTV